MTQTAEGGAAMFVYLNHFQQYAVKHNLSAAAILLWQYLYLRMAGSNQFERFHQDTAGLMNLLQITRQGLIGVRKSLERAGLAGSRAGRKSEGCGIRCSWMGRLCSLLGKAAKQAEKEPFHGEATPVETEPLCEETQQTADEWSGIQSGAVCGQQWQYVCR